MKSPRYPAHPDPFIAELAHPGRRPRWSRNGRTGRDEETAALRAMHILSPRRIAIVGLKGGTGRTTLAVAMATTYAKVRADNILLLDADTRHGSLPLRTGVLPVASAHDLARTGDPGRIDTLAGSLARSRDGVWVLPSGRTADQSAEMDERVYTRALNAVYRYFPILITDCGAGLATPLMTRVLSAAHCLVLTTTATIDGVLTTESAVDWLNRMGQAELTKRSIVALTNVSAGGVGMSVEEARRRFASSCAEVVAVPTDRHLAVGSYLDLDTLAPATRTACSRLAAAALRQALLG